MSTPIHVTDAEFEEKVLKSSTPVVVDFWAPWCGPCRMVAPILDELATEYGDKIVIAKVNTDENSEWAQNFQVQGIPTMLFVANGKVVHRTTDSQLADITAIKKQRFDNKAIRCKAKITRGHIQLCRVV